MFLGDDSFGDYVLLRLSNPRKYYELEDFDQVKYILKAGYRTIEGIDELLPVFSGYTLIGKLDQAELPNEIEVSLQNRFFMLGRTELGSSEFTGKTLSEVLAFFKRILNLRDDEFINLVPSLILNKKIIKFPDTPMNLLESFRSIAEAFNLWVYWDYEGRLVIKEREIPQQPSFTITSDKSKVEVSIKPFKTASRIIVVGRHLYYWEQQGYIQVIGSYPNSALDFAKVGEYVSYIDTGYKELVYKVNPAWATEIVLYPNFATCGGSSGQLYSSRFTLITQTKAIIEIKVINTSLYECCLKSSDQNIFNQIFFNIILKGYVIRDDEKYSRVYTEYIDTDLQAKYGGEIIRRIDNELIPDLEIANRILNFEKILNKLEMYPVRVTIPLNPLIERYDRIKIKLTGTDEFDMLVTSIEHNYEPDSSRSFTILNGYKIT